MSIAKEEVESEIQGLRQEQERLRRRLRELEDVVQNAPGSHSPGRPSAETMKAEREIQTVVLALTALDRKGMEIAIAAALGR
jgi:cell division septum initiation protein DivIVA